MDFSGRTAVVTGAARGIGEGVALHLCALGATVIAVDIDEDALRGSERPLRFSPVVADLSEDGAALGERLLAQYGLIDLIVNNVGVETHYSFRDLEVEAFERVFATNLRGPWYLTKTLVRALLAAEHAGSILFISSLHDHVPARRPHYSASKAAVAMLVRELALELAPAGIRVNAISPGVCVSGHVGPPATETARAATRQLIPLGRIGYPHDIAQMAAVLLDDELAGYVTGVNLPVDGGMGLQTWSRPPLAS